MSTGLVALILFGTLFLLFLLKMPIGFSLMISSILFLAIYIFLDGAGTRPVLFNLTRTGASLICNYILAVIVTGILAADDRK